MHSLPKHMFPDYIEIMREFPLTNNGKIDLASLETSYLESNQNIALNNKNLDDVFTQLIFKYFGLTCQQLSDNLSCTFFDIGGNSILAIQFLAEFKETINADENPPELVSGLFEKDLGACLSCLRTSRVQQQQTKRLFSPNPDTFESKRIKSDIELKVSWTYNFEACVDSSPIVYTNG